MSQQCTENYSNERQTFLVHFLLAVGLSLVINFIENQVLRSIQFELLCKYTLSCVQYQYKKIELAGIFLFTLDVPQQQAQGHYIVDIAPPI